MERASPFLTLLLFDILFLLQFRVTPGKIAETSFVKLLSLESLLKGFKQCPISVIEYLARSDIDFSHLPSPMILTDGAFSVYPSKVVEIFPYKWIRRCFLNVVYFRKSEFINPSKYYLVKMLYGRLYMLAGHENAQVTYRRTAFQKTYIFLTEYSAQVKKMLSSHHVPYGLWLYNAHVFFMFRVILRITKPVPSRRWYLTNGTFVCLNCHLQKVRHYDFKCRTRYLCTQGDLTSIQNQATNSGKGILWTARLYAARDMKWYLLPWDEQRKMFILRHLGSANISLAERVSRFSLEPLNVTHLFRTADLSRPHVWPFPFLSLDLENLDGMNTGVFVTGRTKRFKFITLDGAEYERTTVMYAAPFQLETWLYLGSLLVFTAIVVGSLLPRIEPNPKMTPARTYLVSLFWVTSILIEQCEDLPMTIRKIWGQRLCRLIFGFWIMMGLIITNGYKGIIKSEMLQDNPYRVEWRRILQLTNFTLFVPFHEHKSCDYVPDHGDNGTDFIKLYLNGQSGSKLQRPKPTPLYGAKALHHPCEGSEVDFVVCRFYLELKLYRKSLFKSYESVPIAGDFIPQEELNSPVDAPSNVELASKLGALLNNTVYTCRNSFESHVIPKVRHPRTAIIADEDQVKGLLKILKDSKSPGESDADSNDKFCSNVDEDDDFLSVPQSWHLTDWDNSIYRDVPGRLRLLLTSGIFWLWERWERNGFYRSQFRDFLRENGVSVKPLSFTENDIYLLFQFFLGFAALDVVAFWGEVGYSRRGHTRIWAIKTGRQLNAFLALVFNATRAYSSARQALWALSGLREWLHKSASTLYPNIR